MFFQPTTGSGQMSRPILKWAAPGARDGNPDKGFPILSHSVKRLLEALCRGQIIAQRYARDRASGGVLRLPS